MYILSIVGGGLENSVFTYLFKHEN